MMEGGAELNIHNVAYAETHIRAMVVLFWGNTATLSIYTNGWRAPKAQIHNRTFTVVVCRLSGGGKGGKKEKKEQVLSSVSV